MDIRVLQYFLAVAREESISGAAGSLNMTQPPLSRQLKDLEDELGKQLLVRGNRKISLTDEGIILRKRAEEIVALMEKTKSEIAMSDVDISGDVYIGGAETEGVRFIAKTMKALQDRHPNIRFHFFSGHAEDVMERLDRGLLDFGIFIEPANLSKYDYIRLPDKDVWGVLMRRESPLASKKTVKPNDLLGLPIILSNQAMVRNEISGWMGGDYEKLRVVTTYNLLFNASLMVEEGIGYAICLDGIIKTPDDSALCFRPMEPRLKVGLNIVWKKYQIFSKASKLFLKQIQSSLSLE